MHDIEFLPWDKVKWRWTWRAGRGNILRTRMVDAVVERRFKDKIVIWLLDKTGHRLIKFVRPEELELVER